MNSIGPNYMKGPDVDPAKVAADNAAYAAQTKAAYEAGKAKDAEMAARPYSPITGASVTSLPNVGTDPNLSPVNPHPAPAPAAPVGAPTYAAPQSQDYSAMFAPHTQHFAASNVPLSLPAYLDQLKASDDKQKAAVDLEKAAAIKQGDANAGVNAAESQGLLGTQGTIIGANEQRMTRAGGLEDEYRRALADHIALQKRVAATSNVSIPKEQPVSVGERIIGALGAGLGGVAQGLTGAKENPYSAIKNAQAQQHESFIAHQLEAQKTAASLGLQNLGEDSKNLSYLQQLHAELRSDADKDAAAKVEAGKLNAPIATAAAKGDVSKADAELEASKYEEKKALVDQKKDEVDIQGHHYTPEHSVTVGGHFDPKMNGLYVPRAGGVAASEDEAKKYREIGGAHANLDRALSTAQALRAKGASRSPEEQAELESLAHELPVLYNEVHGMKRLSEADINVIQGIGGDTDSRTDTFNRNQRTLAAMQQRTRQSEKDAYASGNLTPAKQGFTVDPKTGQLVQVTSLTGQAPASPAIAPPAAPPTFTPAGQ